MDPVHQLTEAEIAEALGGKPAPQALAGCDLCATEYAKWTVLASNLRQDLNSKAEMPEYFWRGQQGRILERVAARPLPFRWAAAALVALLLAASGMFGFKPSPENAASVQLRQADADDLLLQNIQTSLQQEVSAPLLPAAVLVQEMAKGSQQDRQVKEN